MAFNPFTLQNISCNIILHPVLFVLFIPLFSPTAAVVGWWSRRQATTQELTHSLCLPPTTRVLVCVLSSSSSFYRSAEYAFTQQIESRERTKLEKFSRAAFFYHRILISSSAPRRTAETSIQQRAAKFMSLCPSAPAPWLRM